MSNLMKTLLLVATGLTFSCAYAQDAKPLPVAQVKLRANAPALFAPRGWKIEKTVNGDLNRDKVADAALVLVENKPAKDTEGDPTARQRALVVLLKTGKGWTRVGFSNTLLMGTRDGGAFYGVVETPVNVSIAKGILQVNQDNGSREITETTHKFRYDARKNGVLLIGSERVDRDRLTGGVISTSTNYLSGVRIVSTFQAETDKTKTVRSRVSRTLRRLDSFKEDERFSL
jgi:hypothetical protein